MSISLNLITILNWLHYHIFLTIKWSLQIFKVHESVIIYYSISRVLLSVQDIAPPISHTGFTGQHLPFVGFTYTTESCFSDRGRLRLAALADGGSGEELPPHKDGGLQLEAFEKRIRSLEQEKQELSRKLQGTQSACFFFFLKLVVVHFVFICLPAFSLYIYVCRIYTGCTVSTRFRPWHKHTGPW